MAIVENTSSLLLVHYRKFFICIKSQCKLGSEIKVMLDKLPLALVSTQVERLGFRGSAA